MTTVLRLGLERVPTYSPAPLDGVDLDLRDNLNLWGAPPSALSALRAVPAGRVSSYPDVSAGALASALAAQVGVRTDEIVAGCGSDDVIDAFLRGVAAPGERVAHAEPSFSMVPVFARLNGLEPVGVPLLPDGSADVDGLLATGARVIYVCSPNNPTGTITPASELRRLIERAPGVVLVDEAYAEFAAEPDWRADAPAMEKVLVTRTFSKAWGLAGLRVGYGVGGRAIVSATTRARGPYKVNAFGELAAVTALVADAAWMQRVAAEARGNRDRLAALLGGRAGVRVWDSHGNFVFLGVDRPATELAARFQSRGIGVRAFTALPGVGEALRIGVAPWAQLERVAAVAAELWP
jgi:histidinol-phosphate aminotransferase